MRFYFDQAYFSARNALEIASAINYFVQQQESSKYFKCEVVTNDGVTSELWLRPILEQDWDVEWDGTQIIFCIEETGRMVEVRIPPAEARRARPAGILVGMPVPCFDRSWPL